MLIATMETPHIQPWVPWEKRSEIKGRDLPGVYLLGKFHKPPSCEVDATASEIVYVGETCSQILAKRWYQFNRSAFLQKNGHTGGWTFNAAFCDNKVIVPVDWLYVAAYPVDMQEPRRSAHIRYVERWLLWMFMDKHGRFPSCNRK